MDVEDGAEFANTMWLISQYEDIQRRKTISMEKGKKIKMVKFNIA